MAVKIIPGGNILEANEQYIAHQCNCSMINLMGSGLYATIANKWPEAHVYGMRESPSIPGTIDLVETRDGEHVVISIYGQYRPGTGNMTETYDSPAMRLNWFCMALRAIDAMSPPGEPIAMPYRIGCGLAGGNWPMYQDCLMRFSVQHDRDIVLYDIQSESMQPMRLGNN